MYKQVEQSTSTNDLEHSSEPPKKIKRSRIIQLSAIVLCLMTVPVVILFTEDIRIGHFDPEIPFTAFAIVSIVCNYVFIFVGTYMDCRTQTYNIVIPAYITSIAAVLMWCVDLLFTPMKLGSILHQIGYSYVVYWVIVACFFLVIPACVFIVLPGCRKGISFVCNDCLCPLCNGCSNYFNETDPDVEQLQEFTLDRNSDHVSP